MCSHTAQRSVSRPSLRVSVGCIGVHVRACMLFKRDGRAWGRGTWLARASLCFGMRFGDRSLTRNACACERVPRRPRVSGSSPWLALAFPPRSGLLRSRPPLCHLLPPSPQDSSPRVGAFNFPSLCNINIVSSHRKLPSQRHKTSSEFIAYKV